MRKTPYFKIWVTDFVAYTSELSDSDVGKIIRHLCRRSMNIPERPLPEKLQNIIKIFENSQNSDAESYNATVEKNQRIAATRGKPQADQRHTKPEPEPEPEPIKKDITSKLVISKESATKGTRLPSDWTLQQEQGEWAEGMGLDEKTIIAQASKFRDYWIAKAGDKGVKRDWDATWRNWIRTYIERGY